MSVFTARQTQVLQLAANGLTYKEIAREMHITPSGVHGHAMKMRERFEEAAPMTKLVAEGFREGILV